MFSISICRSGQARTAGCQQIYQNIKNYEFNVVFSLGLYSVYWEPQAARARRRVALAARAQAGRTANVERGGGAPGIRVKPLNHTFHRGSLSGRGHLRSGGQYDC